MSSTRSTRWLWSIRSTRVLVLDVDLVPQRTVLVECGTQIMQTTDWSCFMAIDLSGMYERKPDRTGIPHDLSVQREIVRAISKGAPERGIVV